jgi:hypothetical protein
MSILYKGPSKDASYQVSVHLAKRLQRRRFFRNQPIRNHLGPIRQQTWPPLAILVSDWLISKKSFPLKSLGQMNRNLVGSIYGMYTY